MRRVVIESFCLSNVGWPGTSHSVDVCEGLEDWSTTDLSNLSDSDEEDDPTPLVSRSKSHPAL